MKTIIFAAWFTFVGLFISGCIVSAYASDGHQSVAVDLGLVMAMISITGSIFGAVLGVIKIASVFEAIRTRLTIIETRLHTIKDQLDGVDSEEK